MKLKSKFILFSMVLHGTLVFVSVQLLQSHRNYFIGGEVLIALSFGISIWLYRSISKPFTLISAGIESIKDKDFNTRLIKVGHPEMDELIAVYNQMIDQLREERIRQSEKNHFLEKLVQASPSGIILLDNTGRIETLNRAASQLLGIYLSAGQKIADVPGNPVAALNELKDGDTTVISLNGARVIKCRKAHFVDKGYSHYFILVEELTHEIYKKEKSAFEKVIRMMSHETNNSIGAINSILTTVIGYSDQLKTSYREDYENALTVAINRNKALSHIMQNFATVVKIPEPVRTKIRIQGILKAAQLLIAAGNRDKEINWQWDLSAIDPEISADAGQLEQVVINILKNAVEAIGQQGTILLRTTANPAALSIIDNGSGISTETGSQLFSPFFSTKKNGQGVGLTLTREILYNHRFGFSLETVGGLTEFRIGF